jgi:dephospho-CoA kinase
MGKKIKIAITGGIGSGKSLVSDMLQNAGYPVIKTDDIAKELMLKNEKVKKQLINAFGQEVFANNVLNTKLLAGKVFNSEENIAKVNSIVHPAVIKNIDEQSKQLFVKHQMIFVESALIYEAKLQDNFDYVILVHSDEKIRIERVLKRENTTEEEIKKRMAFQMADEKKISMADFVIENNSTADELKTRLMFVINLLKSIAN